VDILIASALAAYGIAMAALPLPLIGGTLGVAVVFAFVLDLAKVPVFRRLNIG
jgi:H+-transporting ATPase